jgi:hypothetical protein
MNENDAALFISAAKDVALNSIPHRREDGLFVVSKGQQSILNKAVYQPLRIMLTQVNAWFREKEHFEKNVASLKIPLNKETESFQHETDKLYDERNEAEFEVESKIKALQNFDDDLAIRGIQLHDQSVTPIEKENVIISPSRPNWKNWIFSFLGCEILVTGLLWHSMHEFLDIQEIIFRSIGILAIFICIHLASRLRSTYGIVYSYYIGMALILLVSAMLLNSILSIIYPLNSAGSGLVNAWDLNATAPSNASSISPIPLIVAFYRRFPNIEAVLTLLLFFALGQFAQPIKIKKESSTAKETSINDPYQELRNQRNSLEIAKSNSENKLKQIENKIACRTQLYYTAISNYQTEVDKYEAAIQKINSDLSEKQIAFDILFSRLLADLDSYAVEFRSNLSKDQIKETLFVHLSWPEKADIMKYLKIS